MEPDYTVVGFEKVDKEYLMLRILGEESFKIEKRISLEVLYLKVEFDLISIF